MNIVPSEIAYDAPGELTAVAKHGSCAVKVPWTLISSESLVLRTLGESVRYAATRYATLRR